MLHDKSKKTIIDSGIRERPFNLQGGGYGFLLFRSEYFFSDNTRVRIFIFYLNVWNVSDPIVEVNAVVRHFRQPWVLIRKIWQ
jgi:hypothetical protein